VPSRFSAADRICEIVLVRHADAVGTGAGRLLGETDAPLTALGRAQAARLAQWLSRRPVSRVIASERQRARSTAAAIARPHLLPVEVWPELNEVDFGRWENTKYADLPPGERKRFLAWRSNPWRASPPGGESARRLHRRVIRAWRRLAGFPPGRVVVVAHGGSVRMLLALALRLPLTQVLRWDLSPASMTGLVLADGEVWLRYANRTCGA
jgi:broad specificity phosphatase PhoE